MAKPLNVGMVGYGFMARARSDVWRRVASFFPGVAYRPVLRAVAARTADRVSASLTSGSDRAVLRPKVRCYG
jgi:hypothetical protein